MYLLVFMYKLYRDGEHSTAHVWRSKINLLESTLSFHHVGSEDWTWDIRLGSRHLYSVSHVLEFSYIF